ncbi:MAG: FoF1 ATP synthase subunit gamma [Gallionella sp.]|nr:FoF1 ATP synthase subunit gamma [Gallionella sp.]
MSKRREVKERLATLDEIDGIMVAMKNLAFLEMRRLETFLATQRRAVTSIEAAAQDFLGFYPETAAHPGGTRQLLLVVGSERGFCGDFNETLLEPLDGATQQEDALAVAVGRRLETKLQGDKRIAAFVEGPGVAEEVQAALVRLTGVLGELQQQRPEEAWRISALYHDGESGAVRLRQLLPLTASETGQAYSHPPLLNLEPTQFLSQLTDQYLYAALHEVFYASLMAENRKRLEHMENAIRRLEKDEAKLRMRYNALRQEEIIEEIEIIMLSAEALTGKDD